MSPTLRTCATFSRSTSWRPGAPAFVYAATVLPVYYGHGEPGLNGAAAKIGSELRVSFGDPLPPHATLDEVRGAIRAAAGALDDT